MQNLYGSVPLGLSGNERLAQTDDFLRAQGLKNTTAKNTVLRPDRISKEYAEAVKTLALAQINLGDKLKYCSVPVYNRD